MIKRCVVDDVPFEAKRPSAKYCSPRCRQRAHRGEATVTVLSTEHSTEGDLAASTKRRLDEIGRRDTELGVAAILLARRLDDLSPVDTGAGVAALMKEFRATLAEAVKDTEGDRDTLDDIREAAALKLIHSA